MSSFSEQWIHYFFPACMYVEVLSWQPIAVCCCMGKCQHKQPSKFKNSQKQTSEWDTCSFVFQNVSLCCRLLLTRRPHTHIHTNSGACAWHAVPLFWESRAVFLFSCCLQANYFLGGCGRIGKLLGCVFMFVVFITTVKCEEVSSNPFLG